MDFISTLKLHRACGMLASGYDERHGVSAGKYKVERPVSRLPDCFRDFMTSIPYRRDIFHGVSVAGRGVFLCEEGFNCVKVFAGQNPSRFAYALGVLTIPPAYRIGYGRIYAELDVDGDFHGRNIREYKDRRIYAEYDCGNMKDSVALLTNGKCVYNNEICARDEPRLLAFIALVAPVEVLPATAAPYPSSPNPRHQATVIFRPVLPQQALGTAVASEVHPHGAAVAGVCTTQPNPSRTANREPALTLLCRFGIPLGVAGRGSGGQPAIALGGARALRPPRLAAPSCNE